MDSTFQAQRAADIKYYEGTRKSGRPASFSIWQPVSRMKYFDAVRDRQLINAGTHFWCEICLMARPNETKSPNPARCQGCYDLLAQDEALKTRTSRTSWDIIDNKEFIALSNINTPGKRGPKFRNLPIDLIRSLAADQNKPSSREIADEIKALKGIIISYRTILRIISGQRRELNHA